MIIASLIYPYCGVTNQVQFQIPRGKNGLYNTGLQSEKIKDDIYKAINYTEKLEEYYSFYSFLVQ